MLLTAGLLIVNSLTLLLFTIQLCVPLCYLFICFWWSSRGYELVLHFLFVCFLLKMYECCFPDFKKFNKVYKECYWMHDLGLNSCWICTTFEPPGSVAWETRYTIHATTMNTATWARHLTQSAAATHTVTWGESNTSVLHVSPHKAWSLCQIWKAREFHIYEGAVKLEAYSLGMEDMTKEILPHYFKYKTSTNQKFLATRVPLLFPRKRRSL